MSEPDWENFSKAILTDWPTGDLEGSVLFDLALQYGMIQEVPGGYNSDHHIDADGICPEEGDPWYEYTFRGEAGPGLYSIADMTKRIDELEYKLALRTGECDAKTSIIKELDAKLAKAKAVSYQLSMETALKVIASIGYGKNEDVDYGHKDAFRAVEAHLADWKAATLAELKGEK